MQLNDYEIKHNETVRKAAPECTLLLRSDGSFPLKKPGCVALFGNGARNTIRGGTGSGEVNSRYSVTIEEGLLQSGFQITTGPWLDAYQKIREQVVADWEQELAKHGEDALASLATFGKVMPEPEYELPTDYPGDIAVYVLSRICGEGADRTMLRGDVRLTETEVRDILELNSRFERFLLVLNVGGVIDLSEVGDVKNILLLSQVGAQTGDIFADLLLGRAYPSGKLASTWAGPEDYCQIGDFGEQEETYYREGIYVGYRYFDTAGVEPLFPFGYGLSYTDFRIDPGRVYAEGHRICAEVTVTNTGDFRGKEVVQLYVSVPEGKLDQPYQMLAAFAKTRELSPEESCMITLSFDMEELASYDEERQAYVLEAGHYTFRIGNSSRNTIVCGEAILDEDAVVRKVKNIFGDCGFQDWRPGKAEPSRAQAPYTIRLCASDFSEEVTAYDPEQTIDPLAAALSDEELCYLNIGSFGEGINELVGDSSRRVPGAAGDFTEMLEEKGVPCITTADGPAGLRLKEQYCTMIPIGTAIAQSFNTALAEELGSLVGDEMSRFGIDIWLAPAMNIHRDIRCGRNFEYFSEDPLISGKMAVAITRGVQAHPGCVVTLKHFAANNQETNRIGNNSHISERALREIYLKGFGICVREASPKAFMTSYNLINGIRTSQHRGLIEDVLRAEFGFEGIVMTDWIMDMFYEGMKYGRPLSWKTAAAGGDVMMPGRKLKYDELVSALKEGKVSRRQLEINGSRMIRMARQLRSEGEIK